MELLSIQYLRALAATMVVALHLLPQWQRMGYSGDWPHWLAGGVDIFFVISGFIMWITTQRRPTGTLAFYGRRIVRIVPLYWLLTAVVVTVMLAAPQLLQSTRYDPWHVLASFAFFPMASPSTGHMEPVLIPGWTLNYEMFFYLVFGLTLPLREGLRLAVTGAALLALVALHPWAREAGGALAFYTSDIMLEFLLGMLLGWRYAHGGLRAGGAPAGWLLAAGGLAGMAWLSAWPALPRLVALGLPAAAIVAGALLLERAGKVPRLRALHRLGDASYSLYLSHPLVLSAVSQGWRKAGLAGMPGSLGWFSLAALAATLVAALLVYRLLKRPLIEVLRRPKGGLRRSRAAA